jgi:nitrite reductase/ring-hydroxylating ferredoxin subunit
MNFIKIAKVKDFTSTSIKSFRVLGKFVGIFKEKDGSFRAMEVSCKHQGADLTAGDISGSIATCHRHGWQYDLVTGKCLTNPSPDLRRYDVQVEGDDIMVSLTPIED